MICLGEEFNIGEHGEADKYHHNIYMRKVFPYLEKPLGSSLERDHFIWGMIIESIRMGIDEPRS